MKNWAACFFLAALTVVQATPSGWFSTAGQFSGCLQSPARECTYMELGPSPWERALASGGFSNLQLSHGVDWNYLDSTQKVISGSGQLGFDFLAGMQSGAIIGMSVETPLQISMWQNRLDTAELQHSQASGHLALLLGGDVFPLLDVEGQRLIFAARIPVYYEPGLWHGLVEWSWQQQLRVRGFVWQRQPRDELQWWWSPKAQYKLKEKVRALGGQMAFAFSSLQLALSLQMAQHYPQREQGLLTRQGEVWDAEGALIWRRGPWRWQNQVATRWSKLNLEWEQTGVGQLNGGLSHDGYFVRTRFQREVTHGHRLRLTAESRLGKNAPANWNLQVNSDLQQHWISDLSWPLGESVQGNSREKMVILTSDFRYWAQGLFVEPSLAWARGSLLGQSHPWALWGVSLRGENAKASWQALVPGIGLGVSTGPNRYSYQFVYPLALQKPVWQQGKTSWGAHHRFEIRSNF